jgi:hypothetical protein
MVCVQVLDYEKPGAITALCKSLQKRVEEAELKGGTEREREREYLLERTELEGAN